MKLNLAHHWLISGLSPLSISNLDASLGLTIETFASIISRAHSDEGSNCYDNGFALSYCRERIKYSFNLHISVIDWNIIQMALFRVARSIRYGYRNLALTIENLRGPIMVFCA